MLIEPLQILRSHVDREIRKRLAAHKAAVPEAAAARRLNLLVIGDSWADYPLRGMEPDVHTDYISQLGHFCAVPPLILNLAHYGDASLKAFGLAKQQRVRDALDDPGHGVFDAVLLSMGGDDIIGDSLPLWLNDAKPGADPALAINYSRLNAQLNVTRATIEDVMGFRDERLAGIPIVAHDYDYALPTGKGICGLGPWLKPALDFCGWTDPTVAKNIVVEMLRNFSRLVPAALAARVGNRFTHVHTQGLTNPDAWPNELHPDPAGFGKVAKAHTQVLQMLFPGRT